MSIPSNSATYMAQAAHNGTSQDRETFHKFFECWLVEQGQHLEELVSASRPQQESDPPSQEELDERVLRPKIAQVMEHYERYYRAKSRCSKNDVLSMFSPSWLSSLEDAFLWICGWRPSMAFHLLYSKAGVQVEARLAELIRGLTTSDLGDLTLTQLNQVDELQKATIREEKEITEKMAKQQETVADSTMVELSHAVTESRRENGGVAVVDEGQIEAALVSKEEGLVEVLQKADELRMKTLKNVIEILTPTQAVHFLIAAAELHLRIHEWGKNKDARHQQQLGEVGHAHQNR